MQSMYRIPFDRFEKYSPSGTTAEVADVLAPYVASGCSSFNVMAVAESSEHAVEGVAEIRERLK